MDVVHARYIDDRMNKRYKGGDRYKVKKVKIEVL